MLLLSCTHYTPNNQIRAAPGTKLLPARGSGRVRSFGLLYEVLPCFYIIIDIEKECNDSNINIDLLPNSHKTHST